MLGLFFFTYPQKIKVSTLGCNPSNNTECIKRALNSSYDTIIVDNTYKEWLTEPLHLKNLKGKTIYFQEGVVLKALEGKFTNKNDALITLENSVDVSLIGNGTIFMMNKAEYLDGEWRHGLSIRKSRNIVVRGFIIRDSGGDGIYIAGKEKGTFSENIYIENVQSINNKRQGMSIISAQNIYVNNCVFKETKGTLPEAGLDIEPNTAADRIVNVQFKNCSFMDNNHFGILIALGKLEATSLPVSISFANCYLSNNHIITNTYPAAEININANKESPVKGRVGFEECLVENSEWGMLFSRKRSDAFDVIFRNCAAINICKSLDYSTLGFEVPDYRTIYSSLGGFTFDNLYLAYKPSMPVIKVRGSKLGTLKSFKNVTGNLTIKNKGKKGIEYVNYFSVQNENVKLNFNYLK
jgi:hypothetical protein